MWAENSKKLKERHQPAPTITIDEMMIIAEKVAEETGRYPSYGDIYTAIHFGRIQPSDYLRKGGKK